MKYTVFTVMTVLLLLLLATIAPMQTAAIEFVPIGDAIEPAGPADDPPPAPKWGLVRSFSGPDTHSHWVKEVYDISFPQNHEIFYGRGNQLIKWKFWTEHGTR